MVAIQVFGFKPKARAQRIGLLPWGGPWRRYQVVCPCGYKGRARLTKDEAVHGAKDHMVRKHGAV